MFVAICSVGLAIRQDSWAPIISVGWIPAVIVAGWNRSAPPRGSPTPRPGR
jgi:hypothetical protein